MNLINNNYKSQYNTILAIKFILGSLLLLSLQLNLSGCKQSPSSDTDKTPYICSRYHEEIDIETLDDSKISELIPYIENNIIMGITCETCHNGVAVDILTFSVSGRVILDESGFENITITLSNENGIEITSTNADGIYIFNDIKRGHYSITPSMEEYVFFPENVEVNIKYEDYQIADDFIALPAVQGTIHGRVKNAITDTPLQNVKILVYKCNILIDSVTTDSNGIYSLSLTEGDGYSFDFSMEGFISTTYDNVTVEADTAIYLETVLQIDNLHNGTGEISGTIYNALGGKGIENIKIDLREGINVYSGQIAITTTTNNDGFYSFSNLNAGNYSAEVSGSEFESNFFTVICIGGMSVPNQNAAITPILNPTEVRIILTWGKTPYDLDSHLTGQGNDNNRFHVSYWKKSYKENELIYADLDLDDTWSFGPETITIYHQNNGSYRFYVHDYSNHPESVSFSLSNSGAQVRVYQGSDLSETFNIPANRGGTLWSVFEMNDGTIYPVNEITYMEYPSTNLRSRSHRELMNTNTYDMEMLRHLPEKD